MVFVSQCCLTKHVFRMGKQYLVNVQIQDVAVLNSIWLHDQECVYPLSYCTEHDVLEANQEQYTTCCAANSISIHNSGDIVVHLTQPRLHYCICCSMDTAPRASS
ncbi:Stabilizer of iron transporter SufD / Polynucleotidyl transferase [Melia azedarach]|uniref:Stabilizer of iron transporter SufD / Polynucleotidyl transferase n=1 Tax=Melia azedarach TaxID=155640 RepID=A0ACC1XQ80_MELAZ|nr:Stabilizer of iron transporter SufD / Polynucleotidyl transferase [Melia azedarach]